jgi:hypothetical protein
MSVARGFEQQDTVAGENRKIVVTE